MDDLNNIENYIKKKYGNSSDIITRKIKIKNSEILYVYLESVSSDDKISDFLMKDINKYVKSKDNLKKPLINLLKNTIPNSHLTLLNTLNDIFYYLSSGYTLIFIKNESQIIAIETKTVLDRSISTPLIEATIRGPRDSFTENNASNIGLIRKRIKDQNLWFEETKIGKRTKTKVTLVYIKDIADNNKIKILQNRLKKINIDGIIDSGYIREYLTKNNTSSFPEFRSTERPDVAASELLEGKILIMVENTPQILVTPGLFIDFLHTPEDYYQRPINITFTRFLRLIAFFITICTPGLYVALTTFNQEIIPHELLISLADQREGVPFPTTASLFIMIIVFEILREADIRLPNAMGASISIVGALVLGDAAVGAGIVSPIVIIIVAITSIGSLTFNDIDFVNALRIWRIIFLIFSSLLGIPGFVIAGIIFTTKLCSIESNGIPYLTPISPFYLKEQKDTIIRFPKKDLNSRPSYLTRKNKKRSGD